MATNPYCSKSLAAKANAQQRKIDQHSKTNKPTYYNAATGAENIISDETEEALILLPSEIKSKAVTYFGDIANNDSISDAYNDLLQKFMDSRKENSDAIIGELDDMTKKYNDFRNEAVKAAYTEEIPSGISGLSLPLSSMYMSLGLLGDLDRRERFNAFFDAISVNTHASEQNEDNKKEAKSWKKVFASYP